MQYLIVLLCLVFTFGCKSVSPEAEVLDSQGSVETQASQDLYKVGNRLAGWQGDSGREDYFLDQVQPIMNARCVSCHACDEAPCQLNMQTYRSIRRGFNPAPVYSGKRPYQIGISRQEYLYHMSLPDWRENDFVPVVAHKDEIHPEDKKPEDSLIVKFLDEGRKNSANFNPAKLAPIQERWNDVGSHECVATKDQYERHYKTGLIQTGLTINRDNPWGVLTTKDYFKKYPQGGMPLATAPLNKEQEYDVLRTWATSEGAVGPAGDDLSFARQSSNPEVIKKWEDFFNRNLPKAEQTARYIYEHVFTANISHDEIPGEFYRLVRAKNQSGPIKEIITKMPYDRPGVDRVFYRFQKIHGAIAQKKHIIWRLNLAKRDHFIKMFWDTPWPDENTRPQYGSNNPFRYFRSIPAKLRSQFMMENAHVIAGGMVQGTVCIGSRATYAIRDHFWVWFLRPEIDPSVQDPDLGMRSWDLLNTAPVKWKPNTIKEKAFYATLKAADLIDTQLEAKIVDFALTLSQVNHLKPGKILQKMVRLLADHDLKATEIFDVVHHFLRTTRGNQQYLESYESTLRKMLADQNRTGLRMTDVWNGLEVNPGLQDNTFGPGNPNAWITINRHRRSSTVHFGPEGGAPQSIWVLSYSNFERLYYNLVAHFREWGSLPHKLATWRHMSYVRLEAEDLAISFLPKDVRRPIRARFTQGLGVWKHKKFFPMRSWPEGGEPRLSEVEGVSNTNPDAAIGDIVRLAKDHLQNSVRGHDGYPWNEAPQSEAHKSLLELAAESKSSTGGFAQHMPEVAYVRIQGESGSDEVYSIVTDRAYKAHNVVFLEDKNRDPANDAISVYRGVVGAYPTIIWEVKGNELGAFIGDIKKLSSLPASEKPRWRQTMGKYSLRRTSDRFWSVYDWFHRWKGQKHPGNDPAAQGIIDLGQYEVF